MSRTVLASVFAMLVATSAAPASAQVLLYDPSTWFSAPTRPHYHVQRPVPKIYPRPVLDCPDGICGPVNRYPVNGNCPNGFCGTVAPRYSNPAVPYNNWRAPQPSGGFYESRRPIQDYRIMPSSDDWTANRAPLPRRPYDAINSPFYP